MTFFLALLSFLSLPGQAPAAPPELMALGNQIVTVVGHCPVRLKGVDVPSLEWSNNGDGPPSGGSNKALATVQYAVNNWACNFVRLPLNQDRWMGTACGASATSYQALVQAIVDWCNTNNVYVLLDLHWNDLGSAGGGNVCSGGQHDLPDDNSALFWQSVASKSGITNNPAVFFDLYNEPGGATGNSDLNNDAAGWALWRDGGTVSAAADGAAYHSPGMQGMLMAVRSAGANNLAWAGGINWAFDLNGIVDYAAALTDTASGNGVVYATHIYPFKWSGNSCVVPACFDTAVPPNVMSAYPVMVTEFGPNVGDPEGFVSPLLAWINQHNLSYSAWCMHTSAAPCLISDWGFTPTSYFGAPLLNALLGTNPLGCNPASATPSPTISPTPTVTISPTPLPACGNTSVFRVNCSGATYTDSNSAQWLADSYYSGGNNSSTTITVQNTLDPTLFRTARWGNPVTYNFPLPNGNYLVKVLESENYWSAAGQRIFSISLQGSVVQSNLDVFAASGGKFKALTLTFTATVSSGTLNLVANSSVDNAQFNGIEITWVGPPCAATATITPSNTPSPSISPTWTESPVVSVTCTPTISTTWTHSPTLTPSPTITLTATAVHYSGPLQILQALPVPNPNPHSLCVLLSRPAAKLVVDLYSVGLGRVVELQQANCQAGYNTLALPLAWEALPNGVYFARLQAQDGDEKPAPRFLKVMKLR